MPTNRHSCGRVLQLLVTWVVLFACLIVGAGTTVSSAASHGCDHDVYAVVARAAADALASQAHLDAVEAATGQRATDDAARLRPSNDLSAPRTAPGSAIRPVGRHLESVDDVFANPQLLIDDVADPSRVRTILEGTPGWEPGTMRHGSSAGEGWTFRELNAAGTDFTDRYIQWSPGSSHHPNPYWKVSSGQTGTTRIGPDFGDGG